MPAKARALVLAVVALASLLAGCSAFDLTREARPDLLAGQSWRAIEVNGQPTIVGSEPTAVFAMTAFTGTTGCNQYSAEYQYDPITGDLSISQTAMTAAGCARGAGATETAFLDALGKVSSASMDPAGRLVLSGAGGEIVFETMAVQG